MIRIRQAVTPPGEAKIDWHIIKEIANGLGRGKYFNYEKSEDIFNELRVASNGSPVNYFGISYEKIEKNKGIFWPCPSEDHPRHTAPF